MTAQPTGRPGPYGEAALALWDAGWRGVLPLPERSKANPPSGYTGAQGGWPSYADVHAWSEGVEASGNVCLRLPAHVLGVDVDDYSSKHGGWTFAKCVERWGDLPSTWRITSRDDGVSGIRLYTVPEHLRWPGELPGGDVELLQYRHRYAVVPPSVHPEGRRYRWHRPDGTVSLTPPRVDDLPLLPPAWVEGLTAGLAAEDVHRAGLDEPSQRAWLAAHDPREDYPNGPCRAVRYASARILADLRSGSRHDAALRGTMRLASLGAEGHRGLVAALGDLHAAFVAACHDPARGTVRSAETIASEWRSLLAGAVDVAAALPTSSRTGEPVDDPCENPLAGLLDRPTREAPSWQQHSASASSGASRSEPAAPPPGTPGGTPGPTTPPSQATPSTSGASTAALAPTSTGSPSTATTTERADRLDLDALAALGLASPAEQTAAEQVSEREAQRDYERGLLLAQEVERLRAREGARRVLAEEDARRHWREPVSVRSLADELALPDEPVQYVVDRLAPLGANVLLTAQYKAGKTTLSNDLAASLADGTAFLGQFAVQRPAGRIALWNYEVDRRQYRRWLRARGIAHPERVVPLTLRGFDLDLSTRFGQDWAVRWLVEHECTAWCLDPFARAFRGESENDNTEVGRWLDSVDVIKERAGIDLLWLPTHTGRGTQEAGAERARGATRLDDWADVRWLLVRDPKSDERFLRATGRDVEVDEGRLDFDPVTKALTFRSGEDRRAARVSDMQPVVVEAIAANPGVGLTGLRAFVRNRLGSADNRRVDEALAGLVNQRLVRAEPGGPGLPTRHYLAEQGAGS